MTIHRFVALFAIAGIALASATGIVRADRIFFSEVGLPVKIDPNDEFSRTVAPSPLAPLTVPMIQMQVGQEKKLSIWLLPEGADHLYVAMGWDVDSSAPAIAHLINHTVLNPENLATDSNQRWQGAINGRQGPSGSADWLTDTRVVSVNFGGSVGKHCHG